MNIFLVVQWDILPQENCSSAWQFRIIQQAGKPGSELLQLSFAGELLPWNTWGRWNFMSLAPHLCMDRALALIYSESVCTRDNWEAIWLSFGYRGTNVVFWGILQSFVSCLLSQGKYNVWFCIKVWKNRGFRHLSLPWPVAKHVLLTMYRPSGRLFIALRHVSLHLS